MRILILGGTVFLGRHVVDAALARGHEVTIYTRGMHGTGRTASSTCAATAPTSTPLRGRAGTPRSTPPATTRRTSTRRRRSTSATTCSSRAATPIPTGPTSRSTRTRRRGRTARATARTRPRPSGIVLPGRRGRARRADRRPARQHLPAAVVGAADHARAASSPRPGDPDRAAADHRRARPRARSCSTSPSSGSPAPSTAPRRSGRRRWRELLDAPPATPTCAGSRTTSSRRPRSSRGWSCRCGCPSASRAPGASAPSKAQAAGLRYPPGRRDRRRHPQRGWKTAARRELDDWRAEHRPPRMSARAGGGANPTSVLGIRRA